MMSTCQASVCYKLQLCEAVLTLFLVSFLPAIKHFVVRFGFTDHLHREYEYVAERLCETCPQTAAVLSR